MPKLKRLWSIAFFAVAIFFACSAFAQDAVDPAKNPQGALQQFWNAVVGRKWGIAAVIGTMLLVALVRFIAPRLHDRFGDFILSTRVSAVLAMLTGMLSAIATELLKGGPLSMNVLAYGFGIGVAAIGGYNAFWDLIFPNDRPKDNGGTSRLSQNLPTSPVLVLVFVGVFGVLMPGCPATTQCADVAHQNDPACKVLDVVITCGPTSAIDALEAIIIGVTPAIVGKTINWDAIISLEKQYGTNAVMCVLSNIFHLAGSAQGAEGSALAQQHPNIAAQVSDVVANSDNVKKNINAIFAARHVVIRGAQ